MNKWIKAGFCGALASLALGTLVACNDSSPSVAGRDDVIGEPSRASVGHVFVIVMENKSYDLTFGSGTEAPYLGKELPKLGVLLENYYGTGHNSLGNYISMISGQAPNPMTQADCPVYSDFLLPVTMVGGQAIGAGCIYPDTVPNLADQMRAAGISWKGYMQDMGNDPGRYDAALAPSAQRPQGPRTCGHAAIGAPDQTQAGTATDQYATRHNPFMYFRSVLDDQAYCDQHVVNLDDAFVADLASVDTTPAFSFITPNLCDDGHDSNCPDGTVGGLIGIDRFLKKWVPTILQSPAFQQDGLLLIIYDEATSFAHDSTACCGQTGTSGILGPGGGRTGAVLISPFIKPGSVSALPYNHYAMLRSFGDIFGLPYLGHARDGDTADGSACNHDSQPCSFGSDIYTRQMPVFPARPPV